MLSKSTDSETSADGTGSDGLPGMNENPHLLSRKVIVAAALEEKLAEEQARSSSLELKVQKLHNQISVLRESEQEVRAKLKEANEDLERDEQNILGKNAGNGKVAEEDRGIVQQQ